MKLKTFALALTLAMGAGLTVSAQAAEVIELWPNGPPTKAPLQKLKKRMLKEIFLT